MEPCDSNPCSVRPRQTSRVHFTMIPRESSQHVTLDIQIRILGRDVKAPGIKPNACEQVLPCPIVRGTAYNGTITIPIPWRARLFGSTVATLRLIGDNSEVLCTEADLRIQR
ncbi:mite group 2 allergen-like Ixo r 2 [Ornithodoros turicata]|uniref:mite group 2 allergen-like Ixo r 2 n=1 Tax=Ornithodoros turicata TaxID=34597 RepID=UPI00313A068F